ncbi:MAG: PD-(D/E)XK nuclease family protein [Actinomycetota bacterium]
MTVELVTTPYGAPSHEALRSLVDRYQRDDRLAPVTVIVPSNYVGIAARRALGRARGVAAVTFLTTYRLAELLGAGRLAASGRRPVSMPVVAAAVRAELHDDPGHFAGVETHPTTERSLVRAHRELSDVDDAGLRRLAKASDRAADVVRIHRGVRGRLADRFTDEQDLLRAATDAVTDRTALVDELGPVIVHLPQRITGSQAALLRAVAERTPVSVVAGLTGVDGADRTVERAVARLGVELAPSAEPPTAAIAQGAISVSDADEEVRHALREVVDAARAGTPLGRCAIVYGAAEPYARLVTDALDAAGIDWWGASVRTADTSLLGRSLLGLLALPDHDLSRRDVCAWLSASPVIDRDGRFVPAAAWERASRQAGVVAGRDQWAERLGRAAADRSADAERLERDDELAWQAAQARREAGWSSDLAAFVDGIAVDLEPGARAGSWSGLARWCRGLLRRYFGSEGFRSEWPPDERRAADRVESVVDRLGDLDGIDPAPSVTAFRRALQLELEGDLGRRGGFGAGVMVGPASLALGVELDLVVVLGMAEGQFPARQREDSLLPDRERRLVGPDLALRADRTDDDHRALLAVLAAASAGVLSFPRGDLRRSAERAPSRWLLDAVDAHDGARPAAAELAGRAGDWFREVPSFVAGLRHNPFPATEQEYDVAALLAHDDAGRDLAAHESTFHRPEIARGIDLVRARRSSRFTRFDGNLATDGDLRGVRLPSPADDGQLVSASRLETWADCPHRYFVRYVLGVDAVETPDEEYRITALDRGSLVHEALDRWLSTMIDEGRVPEPGERWGADARRELQAVAESECDRLEERGLVGRRLHWQRDRRAILRDLDRFVDADEVLRAELGSSPVATELAFGMPKADHGPLHLALDDERRLLVRGSIDRVDRTDGGHVVLDYKTGSAWRYRGLSEDDPVPGGTLLQLPLYAAAVRQILGTDGEVLGQFWFVSSKGAFARHGYPVTTGVDERALAVVRTIVDGIEAGHFPLHPREPSWLPFNPCWFCDPDDLGTRQVHRTWERKRFAPELRRYLGLVEPSLLTEIETAEAGR